MRRLVGFTVFLLLSSLSLASAQAVTSGTGALNGRVVDDSQAVVPGVTVTIASPSMMGARSAVSDADGEYRFTAVPPGDYAVQFELAGFRTVRHEGIRVSIGFTATVNAVIKVAALEESVLVTGQSPVVDTSATQVGNTFDAKQLSALPTSRDYFSLLAGSPAVQMNRIDVGGSTDGTQQGFTVYGTSGQVRASIEGINATENTGAFGITPTWAPWRKCRSTRRHIPPKRQRRECNPSSSASPAATSIAARSSAAIHTKAGRASTSIRIK